jgi:hypothetical protein
MPLDPLSYGMNSFAARHGFADRMTATAIVAMANELAAGRFEALSFRNGHLTVAVPDSEARYLVQGDVPQIIEALNVKLGQKRVFSINFRLQQSPDIRLS